MSDLGINLTAIIQRDDIQLIRHAKPFGLFCVTLYNGQVGSGPTVGDALAKAKQDMSLAKYAVAA